MAKPFLSLMCLEKIAKRCGAGRVSKDALDEARDIIEDMAAQLSENAVRVSRHANRKTVMKEDIIFVTRKGKE